MVGVRHRTWYPHVIDTCHEWWNPIHNPRQPSRTWWLLGIVPSGWWWSKAELLYAMSDGGHHVAGHWITRTRPYCNEFKFPVMECNSNSKLNVKEVIHRISYYWHKRTTLSTSPISWFIALEKYCKYPRTDRILLIKPRVCAERDLTIKLLIIEQQLRKSSSKRVNTIMAL